MTIFSTLNNRGLPLSDADIFKAKIYNNLPEGEKEAFISRVDNSIIAFNFGFKNSDDYYVIDDKLAKFLVDKLIEETGG